MIEVRIHKEKGKIVSVVLQGHADSAPEGSDLVCAGVSACFEGAVKALENKEKTILESHGKGLGEIKAIGPISYHDEVVLTVLEAQLEFLAADNAEYVKVLKS